MTDQERAREAFQAVLITHKVAAQASSNTPCPCGQKLQPMFYKQQLGYNEEKKCMCDFVAYHCVAHDPNNAQTCQHSTVFGVPLQGKMYDEMAAEMSGQKSEIVAEMQLSERKTA